MSLKTELINIQQQLAAALKAVDAADLEAGQADTEYTDATDALLEKFDAGNPGLVKRRAETKAALKAAQQAAEQLEQQARDLIVQHAAHYPDDLEPVPGLKFRHDKDLDYDERILQLAAIQRAPWLLKVDTDALKDFVKRMAQEEQTEDGKRWKLPAYIANWLPVQIKTVQKPLISKTTLKKLNIIPPQAALPEGDQDASKAVDKEAKGATVEA
jgi:hypothetical protein